MPPSIDSSAPAMKLLSSEARNRAAAATSSGRLMRPSGMKLLRVFLTSSVAATIVGVLMGPGLSVFTRMPQPASSFVQVPA